MGERKMKELVGIWKELSDRHNKAERATEKFVLNPNKRTVERLAKGVLNNEKKHKLKYCPCRMTTGKREEDLRLICPCNFFMQKTWKEKGECWCSLFVKK